MIFTFQIFLGKIKKCLHSRIRHLQMERVIERRDRINSNWRSFQTNFRRSYLCSNRLDKEHRSKDLNIRQDLFESMSVSPFQNIRIKTCSAFRYCIFVVQLFRLIINWSPCVHQRTLWLWLRFVFYCMVRVHCRYSKKTKGWYAILYICVDTDSFVFWIHVHFSSFKTKAPLTREFKYWATWPSVIPLIMVCFGNRLQGKQLSSPSLQCHLLERWRQRF